MVIFDKAKLETSVKQIQDKINEKVDADNPHELRAYLGELSALSSMMSSIVGSGRYYKDRSKEDIYWQALTEELSGNLRYRLTAIQSMLSYHKGELASSYLQ